MSLFFRRIADVDWVLFLAVIPLLGAGLVTMKGLSSQAGGLLGESGDYYFTRQIIWIFLALAIFFVCSFIDWRFLKSGGLLITLLIANSALLVFLLVAGMATRGSSRWIHFASFSISPSDPVSFY